MDQMVAQRFLAAASIHSARRVVWVGTTLLAFFVLSTTLTGLALTYWYRDCDPMLEGVITRYDQVVPLYVGQHLAGVAGLRGVFLAGLVGASISTVSSVINSHAATFYVDIVSPNIDLSETEAVWATHLLAVHLVPFAGMFIVAICVPWTNTKGTAVATLFVFVLELWQTVGRTLSGIEPLRMNTTLERCNSAGSKPFSALQFFNVSQTQVSSSKHVTHRVSSGNRETDVFILYRLSSYWSSFIALLATVSLSLALSFIFGSCQDEVARNARLSSPAFLRLWSRLGLLPDATTLPATNRDANFKEVCPEEELHVIAPLDKSPEYRRAPVIEDALI
ncbi:hypothetical protein MTO96_024139 [Rhipicephalus appendiculatus]